MTVKHLIQSCKFCSTKSHDNRVKTHILNVFIYIFILFYRFIQFAHPAHRSFIENKLLKIQIFQQFVEERLEKVKSGEIESDEFELESLGWRSSRANGRNGFPVFKSIGGSQNR